MSSTEHDGQYEVYWPRGPRQTKVKPLAPRFESLAGKRIAFLWDYLFRGDEIFGLLRQEIGKRYPGVSFVDWSEFGNIHGTNEREVVAAVPAKFKALGVDAAIVSMGC